MIGIGDCSYFLWAPSCAMCGQRLKKSLGMVARAGFKGWVGWGGIWSGPALATGGEAVAIITLLWGRCLMLLMRHWKWVSWGGVLTLRGRAEGTLNSGAQLQLWMHTRLFPCFSPATNPTKPAAVHKYKFDINLRGRGFWRLMSPDWFSKYLSNEYQIYFRKWLLL